MHRLLSLNIDVDRVRANLTHESGRVVSAADVLRLLMRSGCYRWGDGWVAASPLNILRPDEVSDLLEATADAVELVESIERGTLSLVNSPALSRSHGAAAYMRLADRNGPKVMW